MNHSLKRDNKLHHLHKSEVDLGKLRGKGSFCNVFEVRRASFTSNSSTQLFQDTPDNKSHTNTSWDLPDPSKVNKAGPNFRFNLNDIGTSPFINSKWSITIFQPWRQKQALVAKSPKRCKNEKEYEQSVMNLKLEAKILESLNHDNIVRIHAISKDMLISSKDVLDLNEDSFFIILDCLSCTLDQKISKWSKASVDAKKYNPDRTSSFVTMTELLDILLDISSAMRYVHKHSIMHRDLKPENIGFDANGTLKIFDFGLAVELNKHTPLSNGLYELKGGIGTCRFMAPEIAKLQPYNLKADVYSFGMIMHNLLSFKTPYDRLRMKEWFAFAIKGGIRPSLCEIDDKNTNENINELIKQCWDPCWTKRPDFDIIESILQNESCMWF